MAQRTGSELPENLAHRAEQVAVDEPELAAPAPSAWRGLSAAYLIGQGVFWGGYFLLNCVFLAATGQLKSSLIWIFLGLSMLLMVAAHGLRTLYRRYAQTWALPRLALHLAWLLPASAAGVQLALNLLIKGVAAFYSSASLTTAPPDHQASMWFIYWVQTTIILALFALCYLAIDQFRRRRSVELAHWRTQALLHEAELRFLRSQINSHFLFNALNNLRALIRLEPELARERLTQLANVLRAILQSEHQHTITLRDELAIVRAYLDLEALQYDQRLEVRWQIEPSTLALKIPALALQTLVENAVKHGIACRSAGGCIDIIGSLAPAGLLIEVRNPLGERNGPQDSTAHAGHGIGLRNVRARLLASMGLGARLTLQPTATSMHATLLLPQPA